MGLAAPKKRRKISHDPQNTTWSRNATSFGHRQLLSQGWTPGATLGATSAPHAKFFTKASSSYVRLLLREENLGLGAKVGSGFDDGECTGLGGLQDLLGRLNGKSSGAIEKERKGRDDLKRKLWAEQRYGGLGFVSGGLLVGDDVVVKVKKNAERGGINLDAEVPGLNNMSVETADGERLSSSETMASASVRRQASKTKRKRRSKVDIEAIEMSLSGPEPVEEKEVVIDPAVEAIAVEKSGSVVLSKRQRKEAKARRKAEKAERKLERRRKKEDKLCDHEPTERHPHPEPLSKKGGMAAVSTTTSTSTLPGEAPNAEPSTIVSSNRLAIRQRQIQQKKRSMLDSRALNEILMVKA